ncbi:hypothetical protein FQN49_007363 [Arthroderma sp. PD_2]|nr:hypothetical protein FQN49_007363 [Arthroderma sp. PD_2]
MAHILPAAEDTTTELNIIPFSEVAVAIEEARQAWTETDKFNTHAHSHGDITALVPETSDLKHVKPSLFPGLYCHWAPLIMSTQGAREWHVFELPRYLAFEMTETYKIWCARTSIDSSSISDLVDEFPKWSISGETTEKIFCGQEWFLRLDSCSTKDGQNGTKPIKSLGDLIIQLCTSMRGRRAMLDILGDDREKPKVFLVPYNKQMDPSREFRVFCPPPKGEIAAISQYRWTSPFAVSGPEEAAKVAKDVYDNSTEIHRQIMKAAGQLSDDSVLKMMQVEGFTFDIISLSGGQAQLVEINPFGAMSGCGSCLYHWLKDSSVLYGQSGRVQVKMALDKNDSSLLQEDAEQRRSS